MQRSRKIARKPRKKISRVALRGALGTDYHRTATMKALLGTGRSLPFPDRVRCCLTYVSSNIILIDGASTIGRHQFRGNDLFDPDFTGSGAQPMYFDQLAAMYGRFRVYGSAISVEAYPITGSGTGQAVPVNLVVVPSTVTLSSATIAEAQEYPRAKRSFVTINSARFQSILSHSTSEILGVKDVEGADRLQALVTASPAEVWLWSILAQTALTGVNTGCTVAVRIAYDCEFFDRKAPGESLESKTRVSDSKMRSGLAKPLPAPVTIDEYLSSDELVVVRRLKETPKPEVKVSKNQN